MSPLRSASITVFCGSCVGNDPRYAEGARRFADALVERGLRLVYGGGNCGIMGVLADRVLERSGEVIGVIPDFLVESEHAHQGLSELFVVKSMHERKSKMAELGGAFVALPGGMGTFEELFEVLTWSQLGIHPLPIGALDVAGYFQPLQALLDRVRDEGFVLPKDRDRLIVSTEPGELLDLLAATDVQPSFVIPDRS